MKLHHDIKLFTDTIRAASQQLNIIPVYIEKDYWITLVLNQLAKSSNAESVVFKGGTSLSKGYSLINRFSEDVDIAVSDVATQTGNQVKALIREVEKKMTKGLTEKLVEGISSKGSRFRKSVFEYPAIDIRSNSNKLIVEVNSFANPYPFQKLTIESFITSFLNKTGNAGYIQKYDLEPFQLNVLDKRQTLLEKLVSLIRFSFDENTIQSIASKIRHFYDLYYLVLDAECAEFIQTKAFAKQFLTILDHDRSIFEIPKGWSEKSVKESPLITDFDSIWNQLKSTYNTELSALAYTEIPYEKEVAEVFRKLIKTIKY
ncbi:MAG: nucleotidyl transferase AbiEii/AbiGii toxin family protein [Bacteroidota bacterium]|nr:nucleotidyl transferase AbiEii/AbiGii toxin family protein [Bacteroidota bacterium]